MAINSLSLLQHIILCENCRMLEVRSCLEAIWLESQIPGMRLMRPGDIK